MALGDLTTLAKLKEYLGIKTDTSDPLLERMLTEASQYIQSWLNRNLNLTDYVELRDGTNGLALSTRQYPIKTVSKLMIDGVEVPHASAVLGAGFRFDEERIVLNGSRFNRGFQNVEITYSAGYETIPPEIEQAVIDMASNAYKAKDRVGLQSKSIGGETITFSNTSGGMSNSVLTILNNYKQVAPQ